MKPSLEDHERRIASLEKAAERDRNVERAAAEIVAASEKRLTDIVLASERRIVGIVNERFDKIMEAIDRPRKGKK